MARCCLASLASPQLLESPPACASVARKVRSCATGVRQHPGVETLQVEWPSGTTSLCREVGFFSPPPLTAGRRRDQSKEYAPRMARAMRRAVVGVAAALLLLYLAGAFVVWRFPDRLIDFPERETPQTP